MTTTIDTRPDTNDVTETRDPGSTPVHHTTLARVTHSEWIKLRTLRSTWVGLAAFVLLLVGLGAIASAVATGSVSTPDGGGSGGSDPLSTVLAGAQFGVLLIGVLGCLAGAREYGSRMITATVAAAPRRWQVVLAKALTLTAVVFPTALLGSFAAFGIGTSILSAGDASTVSLSDEGVLASVVGMAAYLTAIALLGLALGVILRSVAASIGALIAGVLILPAIAGGLLPSSWDALLEYLPSQAAAAFTVAGMGGETLGSVSGALVLTAWVVVSLLAAAVSITRRDV